MVVKKNQVVKKVETPISPIEAKTLDKVNLILQKLDKMEKNIINIEAILHDREGISPKDFLQAEKLPTFDKKKAMEDEEKSKAFIESCKDLKEIVY